MPLNRRVPKLKGFSNAGFGTTYQVVNTGRLAELFPEGGDVTPENLVAKGAARKGELIKVLGTGEVGVALRVTAHAFSATAAAKIEQAGGTVTGSPNRGRSPPEPTELVLTRLRSEELATSDEGTQDLESAPAASGTIERGRHNMACRVRYVDCPTNRTEDCAC